MQRPKWIPRWLNVPFVVFVIFIAWMSIFGENNFRKTHSLKTQINNLKAEIQAKNDSAKYYEAKVRELNTDRERLEKIAREQYGMKRENEDVYITDIP
ncbi:MAG: septum formation initiator family protein [Bacteroidales bacterium]|nr:septum formation initiator family protein [Candidatus Sodaliphilus fimicaballi]